MSTIRIVPFHDADPDNPVAWERFTYFMARYEKDYPKGDWPTFVYDSVTSGSLAARKRHEKVLNPMVKFAKGTDTRQWYAGETDDCEEMYIMRFGSLEMNVVLICHIDERRNEMSGEILRGPSASGRLSKRGMLSMAYQEQYHAFAYREEGKRLYALQTANDGTWVATSQLNTPEVCYPHYNSLFEHAPERYGKPIHVLIYGDSGVGKSTFASTFREVGNVVVINFDPHGKDMPYSKGAKSVGEWQTYDIGGAHGSVPIVYRDVVF